MKTYGNKVGLLTTEKIRMIVDKLYIKKNIVSLHKPKYF